MAITNMYGQIDLTVLGKIVREHKELVKKVQFKDGEHQLISIDIFGKKDGADQFGNVATIKASCKKDEQKNGLNYFIANLKESKYQDGGQQQASTSARTTAPQATQAPVTEETSDLPF